MYNRRSRRSLDEKINIKFRLNSNQKHLPYQYQINKGKKTQQSLFQNQKNVKISLGTLYHATCITAF